MLNRVARCNIPLVESNTQPTPLLPGNTLLYDAVSWQSVCFCDESCCCTLTVVHDGDNGCICALRINHGPGNNPSRNSAESL